MNRLVLLLLVVALAGCGNLTAGGFSDVDVTVSGDVPAPEAAPSMVARSAAWPQEEEDEDQEEEYDEAEGELEAVFRISLAAEDGSLVELTDGYVTVDVDIEGLRDFRIGQRSIPAGRYVALNVYFDEIEVEIDAGLVINGVEVTGLVDVELEAEEVEVVRALNLDLEDGDRVSIVLDLNAQDWLLQVDPDLATVPQEFFVNAIAVIVD